MNPPTQTAEGHTPTPWNLHSSYEGESMDVDGPEVKNPFVAASLVLAKGDQIIGNVEMKCGKDLGGWPTVESIAEMRANGDFIVLAVNSHDALTARVDELLAKVNTLGEERKAEWTRAEQAEARVAKLEAALGSAEAMADGQSRHVKSVADARAGYAQLAAYLVKALAK